MKRDKWDKLQEMAQDSPIIYHWVAMRLTHRLDSDEDMLLGLIEALQTALDASKAAHIDLLAKWPSGGQA